MGASNGVLAKTNNDEMSKQDWADKDTRKELIIARQVALYNAVTYCGRDKCSPEEIIDSAVVFTDWIITGKLSVLDGNNKPF